MSFMKIRGERDIAFNGNVSLNSKKITNLADPTANQDAATMKWVNDTVAAITSGYGTSLHTPVADIAAAKAITSANRADKMLMNIESLGLYRYDLEATDVSDNVRFIRPTDISSDASAGRWVQLSGNINQHNLLGSIQGGTTNEYYHLTSSELSSLTGGGATTLHSHAAYINKSIVTAANDFMVASGSGVVGKKTLAETQMLLGCVLVKDETPSGLINGTNTVFTTAYTPVVGTMEVWVNGIKQRAGSSYAYTVSSNTITFTEAPQSTDDIMINYTRAS